MNTTKVYLVLLIIFSSVFAYGQNAIGLKAGINYSNFNLDLDDDSIFNLADIGFDKAVNLQFGAVFEFGLNDLISIQPELLYLQKGYRNVTTRFDPFSPSEARVIFLETYNYIEVPILLKLKFGDKEKLNFFVTAGPSFGYAVSGNTREKFRADGDTDRTDAMAIELSTLNRFDVSAAIGAGGALPLGQGKLFIEARYLYGFSNLFNDERMEANLKNRGIGATAGYMISLSK